MILLKKLSVIFKENLLKNTDLEEQLVEMPGSVTLHTAQETALQPTQESPPSNRVGRTSNVDTRVSIQVSAQPVRD